jgi:hypothetical protein
VVSAGAVVAAIVDAVTGAVLWAELPAGGACSIARSFLPDGSFIVILDDVVVGWWLWWVWWRMERVEVTGSFVYTLRRRD